MDLKTISSNYISLIVYQGNSPIKALSDLNEEQKACVDAILKELMAKAELIERGETLSSWKFTKDKNSEICKYLNKIVVIISKALPEKKSIKKLCDHELKLEIDRAIGKVQTTLETFEKWKKELESYLQVFKETIPQHGPYKEKLNKMGEDYATLVAKDLKEIEKEKGALEQKIKARLKNDGARVTSDPSLQLMVNAHDFDLDYLKGAINQYRSLILQFSEKEKVHAEALKAMKSGQESIDRPFNVLWYLIENNYRYDGLGFDLQYKIGNYKKLNEYIAKPDEEKPVIESYATAPIKVEHLTKDQEILVIQLFEYLSKKYENAVVEDRFNFKVCKDPDLTPIVSLAYFWTPCLNHGKIEKDSKIEAKATQLSQRIDNTIKMFNDWTGELGEKLKDFKKTISQNTLTYKDDRDDYVGSYGEATTNELTRITNTKKDLLFEIQVRLAEDATKDIHSISKDLMCHSLDIDSDSLNTNINTFHERSKKFTEISEKIDQKIVLMNEAIAAFLKSYNMLTYFLVEVSYAGLNEKYHGEDWEKFFKKEDGSFNYWYGWGYYNYINESLLKKPTVELRESLKEIPNEINKDEV